MDNYFSFGNGKRIGIIIPGISLKSVIGLKDSIIAQYKMFSSNYTFYLVDRSPNMKDGYTISDMALDVIDFMDSHKIKDAYIISTSQGGMIALSMAIKRPDLVKSMALLSTAYKVSDDNYLSFSEWINLAKNNDIKSLIKAFSRMVYSTEFYNKYINLFLSMENTVSQNDIKRFIIMCEAMKGFNIESELYRIKSKSIVIASERDMIFDAQLSKKLSSIINSCKYIYKDFSHAVYDEEPSCLRKVLDFFDTF